MCPTPPKGIYIKSFVSILYLKICSQFNTSEFILQSNIFIFYATFIIKKANHEQISALLLKQKLNIIGIQTIRNMLNGTFMQKIMITFSLFMTVILSLTHFPSAICFVQLLGMVTCFASLYDELTNKEQNKSPMKPVYYERNHTIFAK